MVKTMTSNCNPEPRGINPTMLLKAAVGSAFAAMMVANSLTPSFAHGGLSWGQGFIAIGGAAAGVLLALKR